MSRESLIQKFSCQKFVAFVFSLLIFCWFINLYPLKEMIEGNVSLGSRGIMIIIAFCLAISSWYLNLNAESSLAFKTGYEWLYSRQAQMQSFTLYIVVFALGIKYVSIHASLLWTIICSVLYVLFIYYCLYQIVRLHNLIEEQKKENNFADIGNIIVRNLFYSLCIVVRLAGLGYGIYYLFFYISNCPILIYAEIG